MNRTRVVRIALAATGSVALAMGLAAPSVQAAQGTGVPTFQEFKASTYRDLDGQYIVNGDEPIAGTGALKSYYESMVGPAQKIIANGLVVNTVGNRDDRWSRAKVGDLTYCVSNTFGNRKAAVARAAARGTALWERASSAIDFVRVRSAESKCTVKNKAVVFPVQPTTTTQFIARAFFPSSPDPKRNILVNPISLLTTPDWPPGNIIGHELGHTLGFRHEHTRPEAGICFENLSWRPLTPYDSASIMHYPQCNGTSLDLSFTATDRVGVQALYGR
jgi:Dual-action HEIGH metallo-peptidase